MVSPRLQGMLVLLSVTVAISSISAAPTDAKLRQLLLQHRTLLNQGVKDMAHYSLAELLSEVFDALENEALESDAGLQAGAGERAVAAEDEEEGRMELARGGGADAVMSRSLGPLMAPRERKAGCKNFFWKTFTSC